jgi:hypothetical protein
MEGPNFEQPKKFEIKKTFQIKKHFEIEKSVPGSGFLRMKALKLKGKSSG